MGYMIICGSICEVSEKVNILLGYGWELHGGLIALEPEQATDNRTRHTTLLYRFAQAMTKGASGGR